MLYVIVLALSDAMLCISYSESVVLISATARIAACMSMHFALLNIGGEVAMSGMAMSGMDASDMVMSDGLSWQTPSNSGRLHLFWMQPDRMKVNSARQRGRRVNGRISGPHQLWTVCLKARV